VIIRKAREMRAVLVSLNGDFADIVTYPPSEYAGIVTLQLRNHAELLPALMARFMAYLRLHPETENYHGKLLVVEADRVRVRS
jgi:hypothetical protein